MRLGGSTSRNGQKDSIGNEIDNVRHLVVAFAISHACDQLADAGQHHQTVAASDQTNIVVVQTQAVVFADDHGRGADGQTGAAAGFETHTWNGTGFFTHLARLQATAATEVPLATSVVAPARAWLDVIESPMAHPNLSRAETEDRSDAAWAGR